MKRNKDEYEKHKKESIVNPEVWNRVEYMVFFLGHARSGTSLIGALLDAHPNIIVAHEYDAIGNWINYEENERTRDYFFQALYSTSFQNAREGNRSPQCRARDASSKNIPNQWQGTFDRHIKVS